MDDGFGMLYNNLPPTRKLLAAVTSNMVDTVGRLLRDETTPVNAVLLAQNGNSALHVSCDAGHHACVRLLLDAGADSSQDNNFGFLPIHLALRQGHIECVRLLILNGSASSDPWPIWNSETMGGTPTWLAYSAEMCKMLLKATPNFRGVCEWKQIQFYEKFIAKIPDKELTKLYFLSGNKVTNTSMKELIAVADDDLKVWLGQMQTVQPLQAYARNEIRKHLSPNVYVGLKELPLPQKVKEYLLYEDEL